MARDQEAGMIGRLLTRQDVAEFLQCSPHKAGELMRQMACINLGGHRRVSVEALDRWIREHTEYPATQQKRRRAVPVQTTFTIPRRRGA